MKIYKNCQKCKGNGTIVSDGEVYNCPECEIRDLLEYAEKLEFDKLYLVKDFSEEKPQKLMFYYSQPDTNREWYISKRERGLVRIDTSAYFTIGTDENAAEVLLRELRKQIHNEMNLPLNELLYEKNKRAEAEKASTQQEESSTTDIGQETDEENVQYQLLATA